MHAHAFGRCRLLSAHPPQQPSQGGRACACVGASASCRWEGGGNRDMCLPCKVSRPPPGLGVLFADTNRPLRLLGEAWATGAQQTKEGRKGWIEEGLGKQANNQKDDADEQTRTWFAGCVGGALTWRRMGVLVCVGCVVGGRNANNETLLSPISRSSGPWLRCWLQCVVGAAPGALPSKAYGHKHHA